jgi:2-dehydro-3-deoxygluconokinase
VATGNIACFGELLLRLGAPGREVLLQNPRLDVHVGGAEANVAVSLARLGHRASMISTVADNPLGEHAVGELRRHGVDVAHVRRMQGRMGLYFLETGAGQRPSEVLYDRADSAFARHPAHDWQACLRGAGWLHLSGVTPALGQTCAEAAIALAETAVASGVRVSFDGNFRGTLWRAWNGDPPTLLRRLMGAADILFADHRDMAVVLGADCDAAIFEERIALAARHAFDAFPRVRYLACTVRRQRSVDHHELSAMLVERDGDVLATPTHAIPSVVDRIGAGDAFAAGVLHGFVSGMALADTLRFGLGAACIKHSIPGDFNLATQAQVEALGAEGGFHVRR